MNQLCYIVLSTEQVGIAVTLYTCIWKVLGSNICRDTVYPDWGFILFSSTAQDKCWDIKSIKLQPLPPESFPIHQSSYHPMLHSLDAEGSII
jgi:hypothetical protein